MGLFGGGNKGLGGMWERNKGGLGQAAGNAVPRFYGSTMQWGNTEFDTRDPRAAASALFPVNSLFTAAIPYVADSVEGTRQRRELDKVYGPQANSAAQLARQAAISRGMGGGGAGYSMETQAYNDVLRQRAEMEAALEEQSMGNQLKGMASLSNYAGYLKFLGG